MYISLDVSTLYVCIYLLTSALSLCMYISLDVSTLRMYISLHYRLYIPLALAPSLRMYISLTTALFSVCRYPDVSTLSTYVHTPDVSTL